MARKKSGKLFNRLLFAMVLVLVVTLALALFRVGAPPDIRIETSLPGIGKRTMITVFAVERGRGLGPLKVEFAQGERVELLEQRSHEPRPFWAFWGPRDTTDVIEIEVGREALKGLKEGEATIRVAADRAGTWLRYPEPSTAEITLPVRLVPPAVHVLTTGIHVAQGGCEAVVYRVGETSVRDGVRAGDWWFPGFPLPGGGERDRFALFAVPYDVDDISRVRLVAAADVANAAEADFVNRFFKKPFRTDTIRVTDSFMEKVVPAILSRTPEIEDRGNLLDNYLAINGDLRRENAAVLKKLTAESAQSFLWSRDFLQMPNTKVMSTFADRRTYLYEGRSVDRQDHLGFDLASTRQAPVPAANDGVVLVARYLGIYGNAVVVDHGYGLMSLYGHLSSIAVSEGETVERGQAIGRTGETGLAGGDHLHFSMMLGGLPVNPVEWWDDHWIRDRIVAKLGAALRPEE